MINFPTFFFHLCSAKLPCDGDYISRDRMDLVTNIPDRKSHRSSEILVDLKHLFKRGS